MAYNLSLQGIKQIVNDTDYSQKQVKVVRELLEEGNTIPFLARYRKEKTGELDEEQLRDLNDRLEYQANLEKTKEDVINKLKDQDNLTNELMEKIKKAKKLQEVEDIYYPYRQRKQTRASKAIEKGLEPFAKFIMESKGKKDLKVEAEKYLSEEDELTEIEEVLTGAQDIIADKIASDPEIKNLTRQRFWNQANIVSEIKDDAEDNKGVYEQYYDFKESINSIPPFRILALNRGENEEVLNLSIDAPDSSIINRIKRTIIDADSSFKKEIEESIVDGYKRLLGPSIEREVRSKLTEEAESHARNVFAKNLEALLLQPPLPDKIILGIDPAYRTGCKLAIIDESSKVIYTGTIFPHKPQSKKKESLEELNGLIEEFEIDSIVIGNGTASRETEELIVELNQEYDLSIPFTIVDEAGASVYSASKLSREELPGMDVSLRGAVSIARRIQDPLAELVKIDPRSVGVGLYQHDIDEKALLEELEIVVESVVNRVGVDLNTASPSLLSYVSGLNSSQSKKICDYRNENGQFSKRKEILDVKGIGPVSFEQSAGFLRLDSKLDPLARTEIHPESYDVTEEILNIIGFELSSFYDEHSDVINSLDNLSLSLNKLSDKLNIGLITLKDILKSLKKPGRDPREKLPKPIFRTDILKLEDLKVGHVLTGTVRNVVDFGAFVDIGLKSDGLVHISELSSEYVSDPTEVVQPADIVRVKVIDIDERRERISLSMSRVNEVE